MEGGDGCTVELILHPQKALLHSWIIARTDIFRKIGCDAFPHLGCGFLGKGKSKDICRTELFVCMILQKNRTIALAKDEGLTGTCSGSDTSTFGNIKCPFLRRGKCFGHHSSPPVVTRQTNRHGQYEQSELFGFGEQTPFCIPDR